LYSTAQGAALRATLSHATAVDAAKLLSDTRARRDAGDASDLDVNLAEVAAGQAANIASADSVEAIDTRIELQTAMGVSGDTVAVALTDSLNVVSRVIAAPASVPYAAPTVAAAGAAVTAAEQTLLFQRRSVFSAPSIQFGADSRDPTNPDKGLLPTVGISLPLPFFNQNGGEIAAARAEVTRAQAALAIARLEASAQLSRAYRMQTVAEARLTRERAILDAATHNVSLVERAYAEGQMAISDILEARRAQRDAQSQYVTDLVAANVGAALVRVLTENGVTQ
ncbi:MAG: TolC family protein, partial [Gemmatimonadota bacterium]|nr:TolC family protein [Gemmatimonadota bacterium]